MPFFFRPVCHQIEQVIVIILIDEYIYSYAGWVDRNTRPYVWYSIYLYILLFTFLLVCFCGFSLFKSLTHTMMSRFIHYRVFA